ncbi:RHS repeat-associated core domain protein [Hallella bergensis DSM 17361]|uniref:RHS repeat-associated core domain protein n=1 Tax=Hallella bergensis DSM 17361 TaxID=585502 RepID=D1PW19_9BACT|nr:RHS repeat-associated core domain-containing protein [Hallella bergensis]EFA44414.1 RHS repeat-associated core domain protein [Hallella bergensis DSM 17361]
MTALNAKIITQLLSVSTREKPNDVYEKMQFYCHPDHLGSSSYITNLDGEVSQHIEYVPYGEVFIDELELTRKSATTGKANCNNTWNTPYRFNDCANEGRGRLACSMPSAANRRVELNAKELDEETGMYYYGARYYEPRLSLWISTDPMEEKYSNISSYCFVNNNPVIFIDPDGKDWYEDVDKTYQYSPKVHSTKDLQKGQKYIGKSFTNKNNTISYRNDGSILYKNETQAYNRMWNQADKHYRTKGEKGGREVGGFVLSNKEVLVLPDYLNDRNTTKMDAGGYKLNNRTLSKGKEHFTVIGQVHTHQDRSGDAPPSTYLIDSYGDLGYSKNNKSLPVFTISYDGKIYGIRGYTDKNERVSGKFVNMNSYDASRKNLLSGKTTLSSIIRRLPRL